MQETAYAFAVAFTRTLENKMLTKADLESLLHMDAPAAAMRLLADKGYGGGELYAPERLEQLLRAEQEHAFEQVRAACPDGAPIGVLLYQNDFQNLKTVLKAVFSGASWEALMVHPCSAEPALLYRCVAENDLDALPAFLREAAREAYDVLVQTGDGQLCEVVLDRAALLAVARAAEGENSPFLRGWAELKCAVANVKIAVRGARAQVPSMVLGRALIPYGPLSAQRLQQAASQGEGAVREALAESGWEEAAHAAEQSAGALEKWCDNQVMAYLRQAKYQAFGFAPILAFLQAKETELQAVRIIVSGLMGGVPEQTVRERLRDGYV